VDQPSDLACLKTSCKRTAYYAVQAKVTQQHNTAVNMNSKGVHP